MIVVDTSAWVELFRRSESAVHRTLRRLLEGEAELAVTELVVSEALAGARSEGHADRIRSTLLGFPVLPLRGLGAYEAAAQLYRACRAGGEPVRELADCLVAVPAIDAGAAILHADPDFDVLARHTRLEVAPLDA